MKPLRSSAVVVTGLSLLLNNSFAETDFSVQLRRSDQNVELSWPSTLSSPQDSIRPEYTIERSFNLATWSPIGGKVRALAGRSGPVLSVSVDALPGPVFYRVKADLGSVSAEQTATGGAEVFGFAAQLAGELQRLGFLSLEVFTNSFRPPVYLPSIGFDPTTAQFWTNFNTNPAEWNASLPPNSPDRRLHDFRLNPAETASFMTNGFVVSERLGATNFGDTYYRIYTDELPVFITADSILHAWHRSYANMLKELEEMQLATLLGRFLTNMAAALPAAWSEYGQGDLRQCLLDADFFLTVARSLYVGSQVPESLPGNNLYSKVSAALNAISRLRTESFRLFGRGGLTPNTGSFRTVDFSQFTVRGYYSSSERLTRYFKTVMWLSRIDLRIGASDSDEDYLAQLGVAMVLNDLLVRSGQLGTWSQFEEVTRTFVGPADSLTFAGLGELLRAEGISSLASMTWAGVTDVQTRLLSGELGMQAIIGDVFYSPLSAEQLKLPRSFTVLGQKFVADSWALSQVVFDRILWPVDEADPSRVDKVIRRKPSGIDTAFSVFANNHTVPILAERILNPHGVPFRDGLRYQHSLAAVRNVLDSTATVWWTDNIYSAWLYALRALSLPASVEAPQAMRTRAWAMKTLNAQLASWTELRHDTILYVKPSYTPPYACDYPAGFVEPVPEFWSRMKILAEVAHSAISRISLSGQVQPVPSSPYMYDLGTIRQNQLAFCTNFSNRMSMLQSLSDKELASLPFTSSENDFVRSVVEWINTYMGMRHFNGWYPALFYRPIRSDAYQFDDDDGCAKWDPLVIDVHTDVPDPVVADPGAVIHEAVGNVNMLLIAVDNGDSRMVYAGPVLSYYEFEMPPDTRMSDAMWHTRMTTSPPPAPEWTTPYLIPSR